MRRPATSFLLALALLGCGGNDAERKLLEQRKAACLALVGTGTTVQQAAAQFGVKDLAAPECRPDPANGLTAWLPVKVNDQCGDYNPPLVVCQTSSFRWFAADSSLCNLGACIYRCDVRYLQNPSLPLGADPQDGIICAVNFVTGQFQ